MDLRITFMDRKTKRKLFVSKVPPSTLSRPIHHAVRHKSGILMLIADAVKPLPNKKEVLEKRRKTLVALAAKYAQAKGGK